MALTLFEAAKMSRNPLTAGMMLAIATSDEFTSQIPMVRKSGESFAYNREKTLPSAEFVAPDHSSIAESGATPERVTVPMRLLVSDVDTYIFTDEQQSELTSQSATQLTQKLKAAGRTIAAKFINGKYNSSVTITEAIAGITAAGAGPHQDSTRHGPGTLQMNGTAGPKTASYRAPGDRTFGTAVDISVNGTYTLRSDNPNRYILITVVSASLGATLVESSVYFGSTTHEPDGLYQLMESSQVVASAGANGDALGFATLDRLIDLVKFNENLRFVSNSAILRKYFELQRTLGGTTPEHVKLPGINGPTPTYRGIPWLKTDNIPSNEVKGGGTTLSSLFLVSMSAETGFWGGVGGGASDVNLTPMRTRIMGLKVRQIGELETKEATRQRVSWYGAPALGSALAAARASELVTV